MIVTLGRVLIDHLVYAVPRLPAAVADVAERFGVRAQAGGNHLGLGTHNALLALGPRTYLEIIAPDPEQPEPAMPRPFGLDGVSHGRLAGWALACDDIDAAVARARSRGYDPGDVTDGRRVGPTGTALRWRMTISRTAGGLVPFLINWGDTDIPPLQRHAAFPSRPATSSTPIPVRSRRFSPLSAQMSRSAGGYGRAGRSSRRPERQHGAALTAASPAARLPARAEDRASGAGTAGPPRSAAGQGRAGPAPCGRGSAGSRTGVPRRGAPRGAGCCPHAARTASGSARPATSAGHPASWPKNSRKVRIVSVTFMA